MATSGALCVASSLQAIATCQTSTRRRQCRSPFLASDVSLSQGVASFVAPHVRGKDLTGPQRRTGCRGVASEHVSPDTTNAENTRVKAAVPNDEESLLLIEKVKEILAQEQPPLPSGTHGRDDDAIIWWFLKDRRLDVVETVEKLRKAIRWRHAFGVDRLSYADVAEEASTGKAFIHSHPDMDGRPVIVVTASKHIPDASRLKASEQLCVFLMEEALGGMSEEHDQILGIFDLKGFSGRNADLPFVGFMIQVFFTYYPRRLHRVLFVDAPPIFQPGWKLMRPMLKSYSSLVEFCSAEDVVQKHFQPGKAPPQFLERE